MNDFVKCWCNENYPLTFGECLIESKHFYVYQSNFKYFFKSYCNNCNTQNHLIGKVKKEEYLKLLKAQILL